MKGSLPAVYFLLHSSLSNINMSQLNNWLQRIILYNDYTKLTLRKFRSLGFPLYINACKTYF